MRARAWTKSFFTVIVRRACIYIYTGRRREKVREEGIIKVRKKYIVGPVCDVRLRRLGGKERSSRALCLWDCRVCV